MQRYTKIVGHQELRAEASGEPFILDISLQDHRKMNFCYPGHHSLVFCYSCPGYIVYKSQSHCGLERTFRCFCFSSPGDEPGLSCMLGRFCSTKLYPWLSLQFNCACAYRFPRSPGEGSLTDGIILVGDENWKNSTCSSPLSLSLASLGFLFNSFAKLPRLASNSLCS